MLLSIIIPVFNEATQIDALVRHIRMNSNASIAEIIVCDGGSSDATLEIAAAAGAKVILSPHKGRAAQMNFAASQAKGDILYFIHADTFPPDSFAWDIEAAISQGFALGRYRTRFDSDHLLLRMNAFFTRFDLFVCYGGDQTLFIRKDLFEELNGFDAAMFIMEDYDLVRRARVKGKYKILPNYAIVSARKYETNSWWRVQRANYTVVQLFKKGASQEEMVNRYKAMLHYR